MNNQKFTISKRKEKHVLFFVNFRILKFKFTYIYIYKIIQPDFHFEVPTKRKVATKAISYERYGQILFQKAASGYLLHFVQDGC